MNSQGSSNSKNQWQAVLLSLCWPLLGLIPSTSVANEPFSVVQIIDTSGYPSPDPAGIFYLPAQDALLLTDSEVNEMGIFPGYNAYLIDRFGTLLDTFSTLSFSDEPTGVTVDLATGHCFISDDTGTRRVYEIMPGVDNTCLTADDTVSSFETGSFGSSDPEDVAVAPGALYVVDGVNTQVFRLLPGNNGLFDGAPPAGDDQVTSFDTSSLGISDPEGIAYSSASNTLFIVGEPRLLVEATLSGELLHAYDLSGLGLTNPSAVTLAPNSIDPAMTSAFVAARGVDNDSDPNENDGKIFELSLGNMTPDNEAPVVDAGADQAIMLPQSAQLAGSVNDDGLPDGTLSVTWSQVSGPGAAVFADADQLTTEVTFSAAGSYLLRLSASDSELSAFDELVISVASESGGQIFSRRVSASSDDAEERTSGSMRLASSDLELVEDGGQQTVGIRFADVTIPPGATILHAHVQFQVDEINLGNTSLLIEGEASANAATFLANRGNISLRPRGEQSVAWTPAPWASAGEAGPEQQTPDLSAVIQEIVINPNWSSGNALALIISGSGERTAESYDGQPAAAPLLHVEYSLDGMLPPVVAISSPDNTTTYLEGTTIEFSGSASDFEDGDLTSELIWSSSIDGVIGVGGSFAAALTSGLHTITASAVDSEGLTGMDMITLTVGTNGQSLTVKRRIMASSDDAEERATGSIRLTSSDLELVLDGSLQTVGLRFADVQIPSGAIITRAFVQLQVDESSSDTSELLIEGEAAVDAATFTSQSGNISSRVRTFSAVTWSPPPWPVVGAAGEDQQTPELSSLIQEVVNQPGWLPGNALALIITGSGERVAESFDGNPDAAPLLHIEFVPNQQPPIVNAGADQTLDLLDVAQLDGLITDDGLPAPPALITSQWSQVSGPGTVTFADPSTVDSTATFSEPGDYLLRLTASDGELQASDEVLFTILGASGETSLAIAIESGSDDAEERNTGRMVLSSSDLELVFDASGNQAVGLRFTNLSIPPGSAVSNAYIQFQVDEVTSDNTSLLLEGEAVGNAAPFTEIDGNISSRVRTATGINWSPPPWTTRGEAGTTQQTPDLSPVISEIVGRPDWLSGNALVIIVTGSGERTAESFDGEQSGAPVLHVEFIAP